MTDLERAMIEAAKAWYSRDCKNYRQACDALAVAVRALLAAEQANGEKP